MALGSKAVVEGIIDPKNSDLNSSTERIVPKSLVKEAKVRKAREEVEDHPVAPTHLVEKTKPSAKQVAKVMGKQAVVQAVGHIADHYTFKDANVHSKGNVQEKVETKSEAGMANAEFLSTTSGTVDGALGKKAFASACVASARAATEGIPGTGGLAAAFAEASAPAASASAEASVLGVRASANASVASVRAGFEGTPLQASASGPSVGTTAGIHLNGIGVSMGAHLGEVTAGPLAVRAGVKFGASIQDGVPVLDLGPVSTPCSIM
jgi:hypothetical protein